eukprot:CAMPEP_0181218934 /NCGR_PEP_ID=MMETSP1096-20121128/27976_1 /TAXON_ID=156174 ORGANISM="Chrysochromulina ericina, Strain CCMP281" /NCGR_SAMPLE_ID=MMETSP1096 /ASSEMBLY_ACC=CAM_ASM_000453 /LENGTH=51 /DNA_ID=CAMNT_0023311219 /DNA_START=722 /DNA_END=877 /DNA_ORIENTATION=-
MPPRNRMDARNASKPTLSPWYHQTTPDPKPQSVSAPRDAAPSSLTAADKSP